jgi:hypothetical protein
MAEDNWKEEAEKAWDILSWEGEAQWFGTKQEAPDGVMRCDNSEHCKPQERKRVMGGRLRSLDALIGTIRNAEALDWNLYLGLNPSRSSSKQKLSREDITHWRYIVVDLDPGADALTPPSPQDFKHKGADNPDWYLLQAHRIFSGRGYQYWLPLAENSSISLRHIQKFSVSANTDGPLKAERIMSGYLRALKDCSEQWAPGWIVDTTCSDLARVVRCPGSVNQKTGRRAVVEHIAAGPGIGVSEMMRYNMPLTATEVTILRENKLNLLQALPHLNIRARTFILEGASSPGRHSACYATAKNLHELGVQRDRTFEWLLIGAGKCVDLWVSWRYLEGVGPMGRLKPLPQSEVERIVRQVYDGR